MFYLTLRHVLHAKPQRRLSPGRVKRHVAGRIGCMGDGHPVHEGPVHEQPAAEGRQLRPTMCHESLASDVSWIRRPSLGRLSRVNNLFGNHSQDIRGDRIQ